MDPSEKGAPPAPGTVDLDKPSAARVYDYFLGGTTNYAIDREFGKAILQTMPLVGPLARQNLIWTDRVVRAAMAAGLRQFIDLGSGIPTHGHVHEVVRKVLPEGQRATVVYVDYEEVAAAHARVTLEREEAGDWAGFLHCDLRNSQRVMTAPETTRLIDFSRPVCLIAGAVLQFLGPADAPADLMPQYQSYLTRDSWLAISHVTVEDSPPELLPEAMKVVDAYSNTSNPLWPRTRAETQALFGDWQMLEPGLVYLTDWRPDTSDRFDTEELDIIRPFCFAGAAVKAG